MSPEQISAMAGAVLSLAFEYLPWVKDWFEKLSEIQKRYIMIGLMVGVVAVLFGYGCVLPLKQVWACDAYGAGEAIVALLSAIVANQGIHLLVKRS